jgi:hypothetical protein
VGRWWSDDGHRASQFFAQSTQSVAQFLQGASLVAHTLPQFFHVAAQPGDEVVALERFERRLFKARRGGVKVIGLP